MGNAYESNCYNAFEKQHVKLKFNEKSHIQMLQMNDSCFKPILLDTHLQ